MEYGMTFLKNLKTPLSVLISATFATFVFSIGKLFFDPIKYESLIWLFDTTIYSFLVSALIDGIVHAINNKRTIVNIEFYNPTQKSNNLVFLPGDRKKDIMVYINVTGKAHKTADILRIYEPEGMTLQLINRPKYIDIQDGSYYEINLQNLMRTQKRNMKIKRALEFQVVLDDEGEYGDRLYVHREKPKSFRRFLISLKQIHMHVDR